MAKMAEGNLETSADLMEKLQRLLLDLCRPPLMTSSGEAKPKLQIKGSASFPRWPANIRTPPLSGRTSRS